MCVHEISAERRTAIIFDDFFDQLMTDFCHLFDNFVMASVPTDQSSSRSVGGRAFSINLNFLFHYKDDM